MRKIPLQIKEPNLQPLRQFNMTFQINALESPPLHSSVSSTLVLIQCFCSNYSCDLADRFGWVGNTKHGTTNISSSLYIQHMALWILPPFARINFSSLIRATWETGRRDLVMFPAVFHCCQPVMNENSDSNASTMVMIMPMKEFMKIKADERGNFHLRRKENWTRSRFNQPTLYLLEGENIAKSALAHCEDKVWILMINVLKRQQQNHCIVTNKWKLTSLRCRCLFVTIMLILSLLTLKR